MAEYLVWVSRQCVGQLWVEANSPEEAMEMTDNGDVDWDVDWDDDDNPEFATLGVENDSGDFIKFGEGDGQEEAR